MQVDFYILKQNSAFAAWQFVCQLAEQFCKEKKRLFIYMRNKDDALRLDNLLWTYKDISFLPHALSQAANETTPIAIGYDDLVDASHDVILNLSDNIPPRYTEFSQLIEIVYADPTTQRLARERFRYYRDQHFTLNTIKN